MTTLPVSDRARDRTDADLLRLIAKDHARLAPNAYHSAECLREIADRIQSTADRVAALEAENARLRKALAPFATVADMENRAGPRESVMVNVARCRDARAALQHGDSNDG